MAEHAGVEKRVGVRFPFVNLEKAISRAKQLFDADQRGREMSIAAAFGVWEYSEKSSGGFQTIAALKMYGLIADSSAGDSRKLALSEPALRYFRDEREDEREKLLREFALKPKLIAALWEEWHVSPPSDPVARSHLKADRHLTDQAARSLLAIYKENLTFANITGDAKVFEPHDAPEEAENSTLSGSQVPAPKAKVGDHVQWTNMGMDQFVVPARVVWVSDDGAYLRVEGSKTGIPMNEAEITAAPPQEAPTSAPSSGAPNHIQVLLDGNRLKITASVDRKGLTRLKKIIDANEPLLED